MSKIFRICRNCNENFEQQNNEHFCPNCINIPDDLKRFKEEEFNKHSPEVKMNCKEKICEKCNNPFIPINGCQKRCLSCRQSMDGGEYQKERKLIRQEKLLSKNETEQIVHKNEQNILPELIKLIEDYKLSLTLDDFKNWVMKKLEEV
jgi:hypothetical protein